MGCAASKDGQEPQKKDDGPTTAVGSQLAKPEDVVEFPSFPPETKSLLKKHMTR